MQYDYILKSNLKHQFLIEKFYDLSNLNELKLGLKKSKDAFEFAFWQKIFRYSDFLYDNRILNSVFSFKMFF